MKGNGRTGFGGRGVNPRTNRIAGLAAVALGKSSNHRVTWRVVEKSDGRGRGVSDFGIGTVLHFFDFVFFARQAPCRMRGLGAGEGCWRVRLWDWDGVALFCVLFFRDPAGRE